MTTSTFAKGIGTERVSPGFRYRRSRQYKRTNTRKQHCSGQTRLEQEPRGYPMYAVIKTGGKQYRVSTGEKLKIEQIPADIGQEITLDQVLAVGEGDQIVIGAPLLTTAVVTATILAHGRHDKVRIFKMRRRKHYQKRQGHRQNYTEIQIGTITA
jgi:large subunit ribosomal protein L21